jgi:diguanylate cyclase (GGDEF)-like protein
MESRDERGEAMREIVLVVDDDLSTRRMLRAILEKERYEVLEAENGAEALALLDYHMPALILLDVIMPDMDGLDLCRIIREDARTTNIPVVVLSARAKVDDKVRGLSQGADDYIIKPFAAPELAARVRSLIARTGAYTKLGIFDGLTKLYARQYFDQRLPEEVTRAIRYGKELSLCMIDIDLFKRVNDTYGHKVGDFALRSVAGFVQRDLRITDFSARYGGDEVVVIMPETSKSSAWKVSERIRAGLEAARFVCENGSTPLQLTMSAGVATCPEDAVDGDGLVNCADKALYRAKEAGRNKVYVFEKSIDGE